MKRPRQSLDEQARYDQMIENLAVNAKLGLEEVIQLIKQKHPEWIS